MAILSAKAARALPRKIISSLRAYRFRKDLRAFFAKLRKPGGKSILVWDLGNFGPIIARNGTFAAALRARGHSTHTVLCDGSPVACIQRGIEHAEKLPDWPKRCPACVGQATATAKKYDLSFSYCGDHVSAKEKAEFERLAETLPLSEVIAYKREGVDVGALAWSSFNRYMKGHLLDLADLSAEQQAIYRKYFFAALVNTRAAMAATKSLAPHSTLTSHGIYVEYAPAMAAAVYQGVKPVSWASGYAERHHYFTVPQSANKLLLQGMKSENWRERAEKPLTAREEAQLDNFLHERYFKSAARDINVISKPESPEVLRAKLGITNSKPIYCLFAHVNWDACFDMSTMIFPNANTWVLDSMRAFFANTDVNWIVRVHPGEITDGSVLSTKDVIEAEFKTLPPHVKVLGADSDINSYGLFELIDGGVTIFGTVGVEVAMMGKPVILAGESHYAAKGFTTDSRSAEQYFDWLKKAATLPKLSPDARDLARRYGYSYFIQRHLPLKVLKTAGGHWADLDTSRLDALKAGVDPVLDLICARTLDGDDFIWKNPDLAGAQKGEK